MQGADGYQGARAASCNRRCTGLRSARHKGARSTLDPAGGGSVSACGIQADRSARQTAAHRPGVSQLGAEGDRQRFRIAVLRQRADEALGVRQDVLAGALVAVTLLRLRFLDEQPGCRDVFASGPHERIGGLLRQGARERLE